MNKHSLPIVNLVIVLGTIFLSYFSNTGALNGNTMGSLSNEYDNLFTPSGYAFSIWGFIYIGLLGNAVYLIKNRADTSSKTQSKWLILANLANCTWVFLWLYEYTAWSTLAMAIILFALIKLTIAIEVGFKKQSLWVWWPISIYAGWIVVALVANISAYLAKIEWAWLMSESSWVVTLMITSTVIYLFLLFNRRLAYASYVGVWALVAIAIKHWNEIPFLQWTAASLALILFILTIGKDYQIRTALKESSLKAVN